MPIGEFVEVEIIKKIGSDYLVRLTKGKEVAVKEMDLRRRV